MVICMMCTTHVVLYCHRSQPLQLWGQGDPLTITTEVLLSLAMTCSEGWKLESVQVFLEALHGTKKHWPSSINSHHYYHKSSPGHLNFFLKISLSTGDCVIDDDGRVLCETGFSFYIYKNSAPLSSLRTGPQLLTDAIPESLLTEATSSGDFCISNSSKRNR